MVRIDLARQNNIATLRILAPSLRICIITTHDQIFQAEAIVVCEINVKSFFFSFLFSFFGWVN